MISTGPDVKAAIREFIAAGYTVREIAEDLSLHISTVYRWRAGTRRPNATNLAALRELVDARYGQAIHRRYVPVAAIHLRQAAEALEDPAVMVALERKAAGHAAWLAARRAAEAEELARRTARISDADPFALVGGADEEVLFA